MIPPSVVDRILNADCLRELGLGRDDRVLDIGCGSGVLAREMAKHAREVVAVDQDRAALIRAGAGDPDGRVDLRHGDACALPLRDDEWETFDVVHARFVLESLPEQASAVAQMARAVRPGGRVVLADDDHEALVLWPDAPRVAVAWRAHARAFDEAGNDAAVGRKLVTLLHGGGLRPTRALSLSFGACATEEAFPAAVERLRSILETTATAIVATGLVDTSGLEAALAELTEWSTRPDATIWYALRWAEGERPAGTGAAR